MDHYHYLYLSARKIGSKKTKKIVLIIKLTRYKYYKINDYILPSNFKSMNIQEKNNYLSIHEYNFEYTLNNEQIQLIKLINKFRKKIGLEN